MLGRFGRPGLLGAMARTAVIAGTASVVGRAVNRAGDARQQTQAEAEAYRAQQAQVYQPPPPPSGGDDVIAKLQQLSQLHDSGALSDQEFAAAKAKLLA